MHPKIRASLQQLNFFLGRNPGLVKKNDWSNYIPSPYKGVVLVSADFELAWAWRYSKNSQDALQLARKKARLERENMPRILSLCETYSIPVTWFTVGHLFLHSCEKENNLAHHALPRLPYFENNWWRFDKNDWFEHDPCTNSVTDPYWYCPDLIELLIHSKVKHEIGCHTFSHIDCRDEVCKPEVLRAELEACNRAVQKFNIPVMKSFVHPGHTIGNLPLLAEMGYTSYRTDEHNVIGFPTRDNRLNLWKFNTTQELYYRPDWSDRAQVHLYTETLQRTLKNNSLSYFWFHPSFSSEFTEKILPPVFKWINEHRNELLVTTIGKYVDWLNETLS